MSNSSCLSLNSSLIKFFSASFIFWTTICLADIAATLPKLSGIILTSVSIVSSSWISSTIFLASSRDISVSGLVTSSTTVL